MKIDFFRAGTQVKCAVSIDVPQLEIRTPYFYWECSSEIFAGLLADAMRKQMQDALERLRREAYEQGWRDAKAKSVKRKFFSFGWGST